MVNERGKIGALPVAVSRVLGELDVIAEFYEKIDEAPITNTVRHARRAERFRAENLATAELCRELIKGLEAGDLYRNVKGKDRGFRATPPTKTRKRQR